MIMDVISGGHADVSMTTDIVHIAPNHHDFTNHGMLRALL